MFQWILLFIMLTFNMIFINMKHPLAMGMTLLIQTFLVCMTSSINMKSFWFSYTLFLVFIGGMLVLFIYITSLASNEMFTLSMKLLLSSIIIMTMFLMMMMMIYKNMIPNFKNLETYIIYNMNSYNLENSLSLNKLYNYPTNLLTIMLMNYLLITLIIVVKITKMFKGPLRPMLKIN